MPEPVQKSDLSDGIEVEHSITVRTEFVGFHRWKDAPDAVAFLREYHRHKFGVVVFIRTDHSDRQLEFFIVKKKVDEYVQKVYHDSRFDLSCEAVAETIGRQLIKHHKLPVFMVKVDEDGENGGVAHFKEKPKGWSSYDVPLTVTELPIVRADDGPDLRAGFRPEPAAPILAAPQVKTRCFVGVEAEGPRRGGYTLFVPGHTSPDDFAKALSALSMSNARPPLVYYGAGNDRKLRQDTLGKILQSYAPAALTIEVDSLATLEVSLSSRALHALCVSMDPSDHRAHYTKKVDTNLIAWRCMHGPSVGTVIITRTNDFLFQTDADIPY